MCNQNLAQSEASSQTVTYLRQLVYKMETIKFTKQWNNRTGPGSGRYKSNFNKTLFQRENSDTFSGLNSAAKKAAMDRYSGEYQLFKKEREQIITARNRLLFAYENVSHVLKFGPWVFNHSSVWNWCIDPSLLLDG
jgi:hypothetical protein